MRSDSFESPTALVSAARALADEVVRDLQIQFTPDQHAALERALEVRLTSFARALPRGDGRVRRIRYNLFSVMFEEETLALFEAEVHTRA